MTSRAATLLALLAANRQLGQPELQRTVLVKQAYLAETIRPLYRLWRETFKFVRYYYGPYSNQVFHHLDTLIFNGLVDVERWRRRAGRVEARYQITSIGLEVVARAAPRDVTVLGTDLVWSLQTLGVQRAKAICKLVYQEAEFARVFASHARTNVGAETKVPLPSITEANNRTFVTLAILQRIQHELPAAESALPQRELVRIFIENLAAQLPRRSRIQAAE